MNGSAGQAQTIPEMLSRWAARTPDAIALLAPEREPTTYRELAAAVDRLAHGLRSLGLGRGDGIALAFPEGPELYLSLLAAIAVSIAVPLPWPAPQGEYSAVLANPRPRAVLFSGAIPSAVDGLGTFGLPVITLTAASGRLGDFRIDGPVLAEPAPAVLPAAEDIALILHSSGTTGTAKRAPRTHRNIVAACEVAIDARAKTSSDRCLNLARAVYSQGFNAWMYTIFSGASLVSVPSPDVRALPEWVAVFRPTYISTGPAVLRDLAAATASAAFREAVRQSPLKSIHSTASALSPHELSHLEATFGTLILNGYGLSEAPWIAGERYPRTRAVPGSVGTPWCDMRILDQQLNPVQTCRTGEIVVRGPTLFPGYLDDPEANAAAFLPGGWFRTGDLGFLDKAGYLHITGRIGEIINRGGEKIAPDDVDDVLQTHPAVAEAAAFAVPDDRLGEDIVAAVVLTPGASASARELRRWMADRLILYKIPRRVWFVDGLPRTRTGKVRRAELTRRWSERRG